jgi:hypothetical protein
MVKKALLVLAFTGTVSAAARAQLLEVEGRYWAPTLTGQVQVTGGVQVANGLGVIDLKDDLGLTDQRFKDWRASLAVGPHSRLRVAYLAMDFNADQQVPRTIVFEGQTYTAGTRVVTNLSMKYWRYGWIWQFIHDPFGRVHFGTIVEAKSLNLDTSLAAPNLNPPVVEHKKFTGTLPSLGLALDIDPIPTIKIFAELSGVAAGKYGQGWDGEAGVKLLPGPGFSISAGYRYCDLEAKDDPDFAKLKNVGPFVGASLRL